MNKKIGLIILVLLALLLNACSMSASTPPPATAPDQNNPLASPTIDLMDVVGIAASETAAASNGAPMDSTPVLVIPDANETPAPDNIDNPDNLEQPTLDAGLPTPTEETPVDVTPPTPEPPQDGRPETYTLKQGEFAYCIARRFNVDPDELLALNGLVDSEILSPGLTLQIPSGGSFPPPRALKAHPDTYTVQSGDTIYSVACLYGDVRPGAIANANGLEAPYTLTVGESIQIP